MLMSGQLEEHVAFKNCYSKSKKLFWQGASLTWNNGKTGQLNSSRAAAATTVAIVAVITLSLEIALIKKVINNR